MKFDLLKLRSHLFKNVFPMYNIQLVGGLLRKSKKENFRWISVYCTANLLVEFLNLSISFYVYILAGMSCKGLTKAIKEMKLCYVLFIFLKAQWHTTIIVYGELWFIKVNLDLKVSLKHLCIQLLKFDRTNKRSLLKHCKHTQKDYRYKTCNMSGKWTTTQDKLQLMWLAKRSMLPINNS